MSTLEIVQGSIKNEAKYQRLLVINYSPMLLTVCRRYAPSGMAPEDILQDAFIKIFGAIERYDPDKGTLQSWMRTIVINTALKKLSKKCFQNEISKDQFENAYLMPSVYQDLDEEEILSLINTLPDGYRQVFNLYVIEGYNHNEIAQLLNIGASTSRSNLTKAKKLLRKKLENQVKPQSWKKII